MRTRIYFWRSAELAKELAAGRVTERQRAIYLLADILLVFCLLYVFVPPPSSDLITFFEGAGVFLVTLVGFYVSYKNSGGDSGNQFLDWFICLTLPVFLKVNAVVWGVYAILFHSTGFFLHRVPEQYHPIIDLVDELVTSTSVVVVSLAFFVLMTARIKDVKERTNN